MKLEPCQTVLLRNLVLACFHSFFSEQVADCSAAHEYENLKCLMQEKQESLVLFRAKHDENDGTMDKPLEPMENVVKDLFLSSVGAGPVILGINGE